MERSYRIARDGTTVVCDTIALRGEIDVLRAWMTLDDMLASTSVFGDEAPMTLTAEDAISLCELATSYVAERDVESYQPLEERERIALLRELSGPLMDCCCEFVAAQAEVREPPLTV